MSTSSHKDNEAEGKDFGLVDRTNPPPEHKSDHTSDHSNDAAGKQQAASPDDHQQQQHPPEQPQGAPQSQKPPPIDDSALTEDDNNMQGHPATQEQAQYETEVKEQDRWLPIANVARIMKTALPDNAKIAKEAKECMQECVSEFISFITSEASEKCQHEKRKTVNGEDIIFAMTSLGFENYSEALRIYLVRYRESNLGKAESAQAQGRPSSPSQGHGHTSSGDERDDAPTSAVSAGQAVVPGATPGVPLTSPFPGTTEADSTNSAGAPFAYPGITNGGGNHY